MHNFATSSLRSRISLRHPAFVRETMKVHCVLIMLQSLGKKSTRSTRRRHISAISAASVWKTIGVDSKLSPICIICASDFWAPETMLKNPNWLFKFSYSKIKWCLAWYCRPCNLAHSCPRKFTFPQNLELNKCSRQKVLLRSIALPVRKYKLAVACNHINRFVVSYTR